MRHHPLERLAAGAAIFLFTSSAVVFHNSATAATPTPKVTATAAARFLEQAGFGPSPASIAEVQALGFGPWIDAQIALKTWSPIPDYSTDAKGNTSLTPTQQGFFVNASAGDDQLRQRVALAYSQIWVVSGVKLQPHAVVPYLRLLQADAFTTYDKLLYDITLSPAMGHYLDMVNNNKGVSPNENYAREVLQLFSVGLYQLDAYGRVVKDAKGVPVPTYNQDMIEGFSRLFTGWTYAPLAGAKSHFGNPANWDAPLVAFEANHDMTAKVLLNGHSLSANQTAEMDLKEGLDNIFRHANVGPFICRQLIQRLVTSQPSDAYVKRVADVFAKSPTSGVRGDMAAVIKTILLDPEARAGDDGKAENQSTKLREPILWIGCFLRGLNAKVVSPNNLTGNAAVLGQNLYYSPTVFNYYHPGYEISLTSTQQHNAPEFEILSEATAASTADLVNTFVYGGVTGVAIDLTLYITPLGTKPTDNQIGGMVDSLNQALMGGRMPATMHATILTACKAQTTPKGMVQTAVYLIGSSWNYQVER